MDIKQYLKEKKAAVDNFLTAYFREPVAPSILQEAMLYSLFAGGKRVRPILALAAYESCGGNPSDIVPYASALELIHTYSLIHDDLPAMDNDDLRRGKPTNHKVFGEAIAILAGDALLTEAFGILGNPSLSTAVSEGALLAACREIACAAGYKGMVGGQAKDIISENKTPDEDTLRFIHSRKTAALLCSSVRLGPILFRSDKDALNALSLYGENIGHAFQVVDDILDVEGSTQEMGKTAGSDERINKMTYPRMYGLEKSREIAEGLVRNGLDALKRFPSSADPLREMALYLLRRRS